MSVFLPLPVLPNFATWFLHQPLLKNKASIDFLISISEEDFSEQTKNK